MFRHIGLVVNDLEKQLKFYKDLLQLEIYYNETEKGHYLETLLGFKDAKANIYKLGKDKKTIVELLHFSKDSLVSERKINECGFTHFAITISNLDQLYDKMKNENIEFVSPPIITEDNKHKVCFCKDYENNFLELVEVI